MKPISLISIILLFVYFGFQTLIENVKTVKKTNPGEEYALTRQFPAFGEGLDIYKNAVLKELNKIKKTRAINTPWQNEGPFNTGGRINCIAIHPTISTTYLVGCADGGIFKTTDDATTWTPIFDNASSLSVSSIVFDNANPNTIFAGTGDQVLGGYSHMGNGIYKSADGGNSWTNIGLNSVGAITKIILDPNNSNIIYAGTTGNPFISDNNRGIYKSTDGGLTWNQILFLGQNAGIGDMVINPINTSILYATGRYRVRSDIQSIITGPEARIYKTNNGGLTWDTLTNGLPVGDQCRIGLCMSANNPDLLYANYVDTLLDFGGLYKTTNGGLNWNLVNTTSSVSMGGFGWYFGQIRMDPTNDNILYLLNVSLYKSTNGGITFNTVGSSLHADKHDLKFISGNTLLLATDGGLYKSTSGGSWVQKNNLPITQFYEVAYNPWDTANYYGGAQDNGTNYGSKSGGLNNWIRYYGGDGFRPQFNSVNDQIFYAEWQNGNVVATDDGGISYNDITNSITFSDRCSWNAPYFVSKHNTDHLYFGSYKVYKNTNGPTDIWVPISNDLTDGTDNTFHVITTLDQSIFSSQLIYAGTSDARVWVTQNDGVTWTQINAGLSNRNISCVLASPDSMNHVFVSQTGYRNNDSLPHIYFSKDFGTTWNSIAGNLPSFAINDIWVKPNSKDSSIIIASDGGVYATKDRGVNWERVGNNMPIIPVYDLDFNESTQRIMAGTFARSLQTMSLDSIFPVKTVFPQNVSNLEQKISWDIFPNPCKNYFSMNLKNVSVKHLTVYDMQGSIVKKYQPHSSNTYPCSDLKEGYYILSIVTNKGRLNKQLI
ncbi:MAG TPA: T9SS type A sorting domain-containing protein, partial [Chitinophagaceae bacterium]|nr:T9SS type A sorting domain-containing protein [Chitinophagaceae bacterium]